MDMRDWAARAAHGSGLLAAVRRLRPLAATRWLTILTYHRVMELPGDYRLDPGVVDAFPATFERQMAAAREECTPISLGQLRDYLAGGKLPPNPLLVTFDDGYRDNLETALPILQRQGVPAVFFIATDYVEERRLFWWDRITHHLHATRKPRIRLDYPVRLEFELPAQRDQAVGLLLKVVKTHYGVDLAALLDGLAEACELAWDAETERRLADAHLMTWDQVRQLRAAGMEVQSHTASHRPLHNLGAADLAEELAGSRRVLQQRLGEDVDAIAYPGGYPLTELPAVAEAIRAAGYRLGFSSGTGAVPLRTTPDAIQLPRTFVEPQWSLPRFRSVLHSPPSLRSRSC